MSYDEVRAGIESRMKEMRGTSIREYRRELPRFVCLTPQAGVGGGAVTGALVERLAAKGLGSRSTACSRTTSQSSLSSTRSASRALTVRSVVS